MPLSPRPLLLLDVDGPLNPYAAKPNQRPVGYATHRMRPSGWDDRRLKPLRVWLNPDHGALLIALPYELVWATSWEHEANEWISPRIGLPELPVIDWPDEREYGGGIHWKTRRVVEWAAGRPFAFVDDEVTDQDREYVADRHPGPALLLTIDPRKGLLPADFEELAAWPASLAEPAPATGRSSRE